MVSTLRHGLCVEAAGLHKPGRGLQGKIVPSTDRYNEHWNWPRQGALCEGELGLPWLSTGALTTGLLHSIAIKMPSLINEVNKESGCVVTLFQVG